MHNGVKAQGTMAGVSKKIVPNAVTITPGIASHKRLVKVLMHSGAQVQVITVGVSKKIVQPALRQKCGTVTRNQTVPARAAIGVAV